MIGIWAALVKGKEARKGKNDTIFFHCMAIGRIIDQHTLMLSTIAATTRIFSARIKARRRYVNASPHPKVTLI